MAAIPERPVTSATAAAVVAVVAVVVAAALPQLTTSATTIFLFEAGMRLAPVAEGPIRGAILRQASST